MSYVSTPIWDNTIAIFGALIPPVWFVLMLFANVWHPLAAVLVLVAPLLLIMWISHAFAVRAPLQPITREASLRGRSIGYVALGVVVILIIAAGSCSEVECQNEESLRSVSPNGLHQAVVFRRSCGATTGFSTHVSILQASAPLPSDGGNVLVLDGDHRLELKWSDARNLQISGPNQQHIFKREEVADQVRITYTGLRSLPAGE